ncbi:hypothetical protein EVAR_11485_1 [Eumeta japonica]|uniref:BESS domain-containing protein n=1 Tax=Eumeta variegata TaxID=151549 RepID=A0A4C1TZC3_EUMVA|nr:hypothetical protein EVAR_11485_1 [Eumeta japonica]
MRSLLMHDERQVLMFRDMLLWTVLGVELKCRRMKRCQATVDAHQKELARKRACGLGSGQTSDKPARRARGNIKRMRCLYVFTSNKRRSARFTRDVRLELRFGKVNMFIISTETFLINYGRKLLNCFLIWRKGFKEKWKNIRDQFMKEFKKIPVCRSGDAGTDENTSRWPYFQMMLFIKDDVTPELNEGNLDEPTDGNSNDNERSPTPQSIAGSSTSTQYTSTKRKQAQDLRQEFMELEKKKLDLLQIKLSQSTERQEPDCEDLLFFKSLLPYMKELSSMQKLRTRNKITDVIMNEMNAGTT